MKKRNLLFIYALMLNASALGLGTCLYKLRDQIIFDIPNKGVLITLGIMVMFANWIIKQALKSYRDEI